MRIYVKNIPANVLSRSHLKQRSLRLSEEVATTESTKQEQDEQLYRISSWSKM